MATELPFVSESQRMTLAIRMLRFEARTRTIRLATRLSDDQIRRVYHQAGLSSATSRHRGRSPSSAMQFTRSSAAQLESSIFAGVLMKHGLLKGRRPRPWLHNALHYAQRFCDAYADYLQLSQAEPLSFEQAWYLARLLAARGDLYLQRCPRCDGYFVRDTTTVLKDQCPLCWLREQPQRSKPALRPPRRQIAAARATAAVMSM